MTKKTRGSSEAFTGERATAAAEVDCVRFGRCRLAVAHPLACIHPLCVPHHLCAKEDRPQPRDREGTYARARLGAHCKGPVEKVEIKVRNKDRDDHHVHERPSVEAAHPCEQL